MKLGEDFFVRNSIEVARDLLGRSLVRSYGGHQMGGLIIETGAFYGHEGRRGGRAEGLYRPPGIIFIYTGQRGYRTLAIGTEKQDVPSVITIW